MVVNSTGNSKINAQGPYGEKKFTDLKRNCILYAGYFKEGEVPENPYEDDPKDIRAIGFDPNGDVLGGNVYQQSIVDIMKVYTGE